MYKALNPLCSVKSGQRVEVQEILGGGKVRNRLMELGVMEGTSIGVFSNEGGPLIITVGNSRFAIGQGIAQKVMVKILSAGDKAD